jgi:hypothetical protein
LFALDPIAAAALEDTQPFYAFEKTGQTRQKHPVGILHRLWIRDKHQSVNVGVAATGFEAGVIKVEGLPGSPSLPLVPIMIYPIHEIRGKSTVAYAQVHTPLPFQLPANFQVTARTTINMSLFFGPDSPAEGENALDIVCQARNEIVRVLDKFA